MARRNRAAETRSVKKSAKRPGTKAAARKRVRKAATGRSAKAARKTATGKSSTKTKTARRKTAARAAASRTTKRTAGTAPAWRMKTVAGRVRGVVAAAVQKVAGSLPWSANENDPIVLLETDHRRFEDLLKQGEETTERAVKGRTALLDTLTSELNVHELIEEKVLYPGLKPHAQARDIVLEGFQEHHVADLIVKELHDLARDDEQWGAKFKVLKESIEHHIKEEESTMFPTARKVLSAEELKGLGARMREMKREAERRT